MKNIEVALIWYDQRDGQGVVKDHIGNEYYIDSSTLNFDQKQLTTHEGRGVSKFGLSLLLDLNESIKHCRCGMNVRIK